MRRAQLLDWSLTWRAALTVSASPRVIAGMSPKEFSAAVQSDKRARGGLRILGPGGQAAEAAEAAVERAVEREAEHEPQH